MRREFVLTGVARQARRPASSIACLAFVAVLGATLWAGVVWIAEAILRSPGLGL